MKNKSPDHIFRSKSPEHLSGKSSLGHMSLKNLPDHRKSDELDVEQNPVTNKAIINENYNNYTKMKPDNCSHFPDIILVGFEKCGTITLLSYLGTHPEILLTSAGVIHYFDSDFRTNSKVFPKRTPCKPTPQRKLKLEKISVFGSAMKVYESIPNVKLLAIVREPVERVMSHYVHLVAERKEKPNNFDARIKTFLDNRTNENETITSSGMFRQSTYIDRLQQWFQVFGRDKIHVVDGDNFVKHPASTLNKIETFLNISSYFTDDHFVYNKEKKFYCLKKSGCMGKQKGRPHPNMTDITRKRLQAYFKPFNEKLFNTLGQRFSWNY